MDTFGNNLKSCLQIRGISQKKLAELTGLTQPAISQIVSGKRQPLLNTAITISDMLRVPIGELVGLPRKIKFINNTEYAIDRLDKLQVEITEILNLLLKDPK